MATITRRPLRVARNMLHNDPGFPIDATLQNKSGDTVPIGAPVLMDGTPELTVADVHLVNAGASDDQIDISDAIASLVARLYGITLKAFPASGQIIIPVALWVPGLIVEANLHEGDNGASPGTHVAAATDVGSEVSMVLGDDGFWYFTTSASEKIGIVRAFPGIVGDITSGGGVGDTNARAHVLLYANVGLFGHLAA